MIKSEELVNENSCMSKAHPEEMTFVLLARDAAAPEAIRYWVRQRIWLGKNEQGDAQITEAVHCALEMERQRASGRFKRDSLLNVRDRPTQCGCAVVCDDQGCRPIRCRGSNTPGCRA